MLLQDDPEADCTRPCVYEVSDGVYRIPLPLPNDGLRAHVRPLRQPTRDRGTSQRPPRGQHAQERLLLAPDR